MQHDIGRRDAATNRVADRRRREPGPPARGPFFEAGLDLEVDVDSHIEDLDEVELDVDLQLDFIGFLL